MYSVELFETVRLAVVDEGLSHHEAALWFGIDRRPKLDGLTGIIDAILEPDRDVPRKQRHTAQRIFQ